MPRRVCQDYDELLARCRSRKKQEYVTEQLECMLIEGLTMEQALRTNFERLGEGRGKKTFMDFIEHRRSRGWIINEKNGVYKVVGIVPVS